MPPQLATLICIVFVLYLFRMDRKESYGHSNALWIPLAWMFLAAGRYVSSWLDLRPATMSVATYSEGSPIDAAAFSLLIAAGILVLSRRKIDWYELLSKNKWIWLYFLYCGVSVIWSDDSFISFKRWIKELGNPVMVLIILTERRPYEAVGFLLRRLGFLWLPLSVLFVKYYPDLGRAYHFDGTQMFTGIGQQKNDLGLICLLSTIYFSWNVLVNRRGQHITDFVLMGMLSWLFYLSDSKTALACALAAVSLFVMSRTVHIRQRPQRVVMLLVVITFTFFLLEAILDLSDLVFRALGRDSTLTSRVPIWNVLSEMATNPVIGTGYQSFWLGGRVEIILETIGAEINQAHNGYLEQYLNLGYVGVAFILAIMLTGLAKVRKHLVVDPQAAMLRLCFIGIAGLYNYTEASFYGINNMWLLFLLGTIDVTGQRATVGIERGHLIGEKGTPHSSRDTDTKRIYCEERALSGREVIASQSWSVGIKQGARSRAAR